MTKLEAEQLAREAQKYIKRRKVSSFPHPQGLGDVIIDDLQFVGTQGNIVDGEYSPLGVWQNRKGEYSTQNLIEVVEFFKNNPERAEPQAVVQIGISLPFSTLKQFFVT